MARPAWSYRGARRNRWRRIWRSLPRLCLERGQIVQVWIGTIPPFTIGAP